MGLRPKAPPAFLKKAGEKHFFAAEHPTHSVRAAAKRRCNTRGRASKNNKFYLSRKHARFRAINASTKTQTANQNTIITKTKNFIKHRLC